MRRPPPFPVRIAALLTLLTLARCDAAEPKHADPDAQVPDAPGPDTHQASDRAFDLPEEADYAAHPGLGVSASRRHLIVVADRAWASVPAFEALATEVGATLGGYVDGAGVAQLVWPSAVVDFAALDSARALLAARPEILGVTLDLPLGPTYLPAGWKDPQGVATHLNDIRALSAWNLIPRLELQSPRPDVPVAVIDVGFDAHPDLDGVLTVPFGRRDGHGLMVAGLIGARHAAGTGAMGVSPFVTIEGFKRGPFLALLSLAGALESLLGSAASGHRLANVSLGNNWYRSCLPRCDPTGRAADSTCDAPAVRADIRAGGQALAAVVAELNQRAPLFVVVAAGNDSGTGMLPDLCGTARSALGDFPAALASSIANAALEWPDARDHMIVVSAVTHSDERAPFGNSGADVWAPGHDVVGLALGGGTAVASGTSLAAPVVTGAAAFLVAVEPGLTNAELRTLITSEATTDPVVGGIGRRANLMKALLAIDSTHPGRREEDAVLFRLADMDDGTRDGFERFVWGPTGERGEIYRDDALGSDGAVDFRDFRRLRDAIRMVALNAPIEGELGHPKHDLNGDGDSDAPGSELAELANLDAERKLDADDVTAFQRVYTPGEPQRWLGADLPALLASSDLRIYAAAAISALNAQSVVLTIEGQAPGAPPSDLTPLQSLPMSPAEDGLVLTTPLTSGARVRWHAICADQTQREEHVVEVGELEPGRDQAVVLDPTGATPCCQGAGCSPTVDPRLDHEYVDILEVEHELWPDGSAGWNIKRDHRRTMHRDIEGDGEFLNEHTISVWNEETQRYDINVQASLMTCIQGRGETRSYTVTAGVEETTHVAPHDAGCAISLLGHPVPYCFHGTPVACNGETLIYDHDNGIQRSELFCTRFADGVPGPNLGVCF